jgi:hypothetical protein
VRLPVACAAAVPDAAGSCANFVLKVASVDIYDDQARKRSILPVKNRQDDSTPSRKGIL